MSPHFDLCNPTEEHRLLRETVRSFAKEKVAPQAEEHDVAGTFNTSLLRAMGELGLLGVTVPEAEGGAGLDATAAVIIHHELAKYDPGFALAYLAHEVLFVNNFAHAADAKQRSRYLPKALTGEVIGCMGMTEPGAGTDVLGMSTTATRDGDDYVLRGAKTFITNAYEAGLYLIYAKINGRISTFVVERNTRGMTVGKPLKKLGMRASTMAEITFDDARVPAANLLGAEGGGVPHMMRNLEIERLTLAAISLGIADRSVDVMVRYAEERKAFGQPLNHFGQIQKHIADGFAKTEAMRALVYNVARDVGPTSRNRLGTDAAKLFAATAAKEVADSAIQVLGGYGYCQEYHVERLWRDAKLLEIGGGTLESHQKNITRDLTKAQLAHQA
ncbi:MAG: acyl-CoA dehydrogenase family protein [Deltaproteobacteria bacterium]|nr:acyl-CoA dehydrogenase family protein [Deltaproteobacteria bacterium]